MRKKYLNQNCLLFFMNTFQKAAILTNAGQFDSCGPKMCEVNIREGLGGIYHAKAEHKTCRLFKTLMTNSCSYDCKYCGNAKGCESKKASYAPEELSNLFMHLHKTLDVYGLFLSSGIKGDADSATQKMIEAASILRNKHQFNGYIHLKILPGTSYDLIKQAADVSNRLSINLEAPNKSVLSELSTTKDYKIDILRRQAWISKMKLTSGQTTQLIINDMASDKDVISMMKWEYENLNMRRVYYSAFRPVKGTALENKTAEKIERQNHLYNVDFLIRDYGFSTKEFESIMDSDMLPLNIDPKLALAKANITKPIEINEAEYNELIRIPGIGPATAENILKTKKITSYLELSHLGARVDAARPFISLEGKRQATLMEY